jgi:DNA polymerase elongation subunit (family B)
MTVNEIVQFLKDKPYAKEMGAGKLSKWLNCSREDVYNAKQILKKSNKKLPRVLLLDIETTPLEAYIWQMQVWKARVNDEAVISRWFCLTWSAKWLFSNVLMSMKLTGEEVKDENDSRIIDGLWKVLNEADIVIAHNGDNFDIPNINTRFIVNGLPPTKPYNTIDTLRIAQRQFGFSHNSLNALARVFGLPEKIDTGFDLWKRCKNGDDNALLEMETYNRHDVEVLEEVYLKIRPWIKSHPNLALYTEFEGEMCPNCGSTNLTEDGFYYTQTGKYQTLRCECGAFGRRRQSVLDKEKRKNLIVSVAK